MTPDFMTTVLISLLSGGFTGLITFATMKNDILWIKRLLFQHDEIIKKLGEKV